jgi:hypothetical protein
MKGQRMSLTTKIAAAALTAAVPLALAAAPAEAGSRWTERSSGSFADTTWLEMGELPGGVAGNAHVGFLRVEGDKSPWVYGEITDWTCPDGVLPPMFGGGHGEEPPETECVLESQRSLYNAGPVTLTVDRKLNKATLTGPLEVADHEGGGATGQPMANITWTGVGGTGTSTYYDKYTDDEGNRFTMRRTETSRQGTLSGTLGAMAFDDDADDESYGYFGTFKTASTSVNP